MAAIRTIAIRTVNILITIIPNTIIRTLGIPVTDILYALKRRAIKDEAYPKRFPPPVLAEEFRNMLRTHGRISESRLMVRLAMRTDPRGLFSKMGLGIDLMKTGRFDPGQDRVRDREQIRTLLEQVHREEATS